MEERIVLTAGAGGLKTAALGDIAYFAMTTPETGEELFRSDGAASGTQLVRDIRPGDRSSAPDELTVVGQTLFFTAETAGQGRALWTTDGTSVGTRQAADLPSLTPRDLTAVGNWLYFVGDDVSGKSGPTLYRTDAAGASITPVFTSGGDAVHGYLGELKAVGDTLYFAAFTEQTGVELFQVTGSASSASLTKDLVPGPASGQPRELQALGGALYFVADHPQWGAELWKSVNASGVTSIVGDLSPGAAGSDPASLRTVGSHLVFTANVPGRGRDLWTVADNSDTITLLKDAPAGSTPRILGGDARYAYFTSDDVSGGSVHIWVTDATTAGTRELGVSASPLAVPELAVLPGGLIFSAWTPQGVSLQRMNLANGVVSTLAVMDGHPLQADVSAPWVVGDKAFLLQTDYAKQSTRLWVTAGTPDDTFPLRAFDRNIVPSSFPEKLTKVGNQVFFTAVQKGSGRELWVTDASSAPGSTHMVLDITPGAASTTFESLIDGNTLLYFLTRGSDKALDLWRSDGTAVGTWKLMDGTPLQGVSGNYAVGPGGNLYFTRNVSGGSVELWTSDGSVEGTKLVQSFGKDPAYSGENALGNLTIDSDGRLVFSHAVSNGVELWLSDGSPFGAVLFDFLATPRPDAMGGMTVAGPLIYFAFDDGLHGQELWVSNGSMLGTRMVYDVMPGPDGSAPGFVTVYGDRVYFAADDGVHGREMWFSSGSEAGTSLLSDAVPGPLGSSPSDGQVLGDKVLFTGVDETGAGQLWSVPNTAADIGGAGPIMQFPLTSPGGDAANVGWDLMPFGQKVAFLHSDADHGRELWSTDGTPQGTQLVADIYPGADGSQLLGLTPVGDSQWIFSADDGQSGQELWTTNGSSAVTRLLADINTTSDLSPTDNPGTGPGALVKAEPYWTQLDPIGTIRNIFVTLSDGQILPVLKNLIPITVGLTANLNLSTRPESTGDEATTFRYRLGDQAPPGAVIDPITGKLTWDILSASGQHDIPVIAYDPAHPEIQVTRNVDVFVWDRLVTINPFPSDPGATPPTPITGAVFSHQGHVSGLVPRALPVTITADYGDGVIAPVAPDAQGNFTLEHTYQQPGNRSVVITVRDPMGEVTSATLPVNVRTNTAPQLALPVALTTGVGQSFQFTSAVIDPDADLWTATVDYGDGSGPRPLAILANRTFTLQSVYATAGQREVRVKVTDPYGGTALSVLPVTVMAPRKITSVSFTPGATLRASVQWDGVLSVIPTDAFRVTDARGLMWRVSVTTSTADGKTTAVVTATAPLAAAVRGRTPVVTNTGPLTLTILGDQLRDTLGLAADVNGDGLPGGVRTDRFTPTTTPTRPTRPAPVPRPRIVPVRTPPTRPVR